MIKKPTLLILCAIMLFVAQTKPPAYILKDAVPGMPLHGEYVVHGRTLISVQATLNKTLTAMGWKILSSSTGRPPMPALSMAAVMYPGSDPAKRQGLFVDVDVNAGNSTITADWYLVIGSSRPKSEAKNFYDEFFTKLAEALK